MQKKWRILIGVLVVVVLAAVIVLLNGDPLNFHDKYEGKDLSTDVTGIGRDDTYEAYMMAHRDAPAGTQDILVDVAAFEGDGELQQDAQGQPEVYTADGEYTTWKVTLPAEGMYTVEAHQFTLLT